MPVSKKKDKSVGVANVAKRSPKNTSRTKDGSFSPKSKDSGESENKATGKPAASVKQVTRTSKAALSPADMDAFQRDLIKMRDRLTGKMVQIRSESLTRDDEVNPEEDGTDAFERLFSLEQASNDQDMIFNIDGALRAIEQKTYGVCENCGCLIEKARLQALPFAQNCIKCQSEIEASFGAFRSGKHR